MVQNGVTIIDNAAFEKASGMAVDPAGTGNPGPILLQSHGGNKVRFRNIRLKELTADSPHRSPSAPR